MPKSYSVLLIGSGGREHTMAWKLAQSPLLNKLYTAPGNPGTAEHGSNVDLDTDDFEAVRKFVADNQVDLVIVGPEKPLVNGISDYLKKHDIKVFGPDKKAALLEGSKEFAKDFMKSYRIPTAGYQTFTSDQFDKAYEYVLKQDSYPAVLKADGLAGGKGVFICKDAEEVKERLDQLSSDPALRNAADKLVIEEFMEGEEASVFAISDGESYKIIGNAQDHKRIGEGDTGLNTGGMGAYSPAPLMTEDLLLEAEEKIIRPVINGMKSEGTPYKGILYAGLMITKTGPKVVEFNCRFGDPECQAILPALKNDFLELCIAVCEGRLQEIEPEFEPGYRTCVVMASEGYPEKYEKGKIITGIENVDNTCLVFHAGTATKDQKLVTNGGRVLNVVGRGKTLEDSINHAYDNIKRITFPNAYYRKDIGHKGLKRL